MIFVLSTFRAIFCWMQLKKLMEKRPRCSFSTPRVLAVACHGRTWHVLLSSCISEIAARLSQWTHIEGNFQLINQLWTNKSSHPVSAAGTALLPVQSRTEKLVSGVVPFFHSGGPTEISHCPVSLPPFPFLSIYHVCVCATACSSLLLPLCGFQNETQVSLLDCLYPLKINWNLLLLLKSLFSSSRLFCIHYWVI